MISLLIHGFLPVNARLLIAFGTAFYAINIDKFSFFKTKINLECNFSLLINVKMPLIVGILTFTSRKNFMLN